MSNERWTMPEWMKDLCPAMHIRADAYAPNRTMTMESLHYYLNLLRTAGLLQTKGERADYDQFKAYLKQLPEGYDIGDDATVELAIKSVDLDNEIARLKAENAALHSRCVMEENELFRDLRAENERLREACKAAQIVMYQSQEYSRGDSYTVRTINEINTALGGGD